MNIKELRKKHGLSQQGLADKIGIPRGRLAKWEEGKANPKAEDFNKLKVFFDEPAKEGMEKPSLETCMQNLISVLERLVSVIEKSMPR